VNSRRSGSGVAAAVAVIALGPAQRAWAQGINVGPEVHVSSPSCAVDTSGGGIEVALIVSPVDNRRLVAAWNQVTGGGYRVYYSVSVNRGASFQCPNVIPFPACFPAPQTSVDPMVAASG
jgi:hypothetical protein